MKNTDEIVEYLKTQIALENENLKDAYPAGVNSNGYGMALASRDTLQAVLNFILEQEL